jgi:hypothetical protein
VDETGLGKPICDQLRHDGVAITPVVFRYRSRIGKPTKADFIEHLRLLLDRHELTLLRDLTQRAELESFTSHTTPSGNIVYEAPSGQHDDTVMALTLACFYMELSARPKAEKPSRALTLSEQYIKAGLDKYDQPMEIDFLDYVH